MTERQRQILQFAKEHGVITTKEAVNLIGGNYYHNGEKHTGEVLHRMVKTGLLTRVKQGHYAANKKKQVDIIDKTQMSFFETLPPQ